MEAIQIKVKVIANASKCEVIPLSDDQTAFKVKLTAPALENRANRQLCEVLADYFKVPKRNVCLLSGEHNNHKCIRISREDCQVVKNFHSGQRPMSMN